MVMAHPIGPPQSQPPPAHHPPLSGPSDRERAEQRDRAGPSGQAVIRHGSSWFQRKINLRPQHRGGHLITDEILKQVPEIQQFAVGLLHIQIMHTSASLALNENWDPDVRDDVENFMNKLVPENLPYQHSCEGPDDMIEDRLRYLSRRRLPVVHLQVGTAETGRLRLNNVYASGWQPSVPN